MPSNLCTYSRPVGMLVTKFGSGFGAFSVTATFGSSGLWQFSFLLTLFTSAASVSVPSSPLVRTNDCQADKKRYLNLEFFPFEGPIPEYSVTRSSLPSPPVITIVEEDN